MTPIKIGTFLRVIVFLLKGQYKFSPAMLKSTQCKSDGVNSKRRAALVGLLLNYSVYACYSDSHSHLSSSVDTPLVLKAPLVTTDNWNPLLPAFHHARTPPLELGVAAPTNTITPSESWLERQFKGFLHPSNDHLHNYKNNSNSLTQGRDEYGN